MIVTGNRAFTYYGRDYGYALYECVDGEEIRIGGVTSIQEVLEEIYHLSIEKDLAEQGYIEIARKDGELQTAVCPECHHHHFVIYWNIVLQSDKPVGSGDSKGYQIGGHCPLVKRRYTNWSLFSVYPPPTGFK